MAGKLSSVCAGLALGALAASYALGGVLAGLPWIALAGGLWLVGRWRGWPWTASALFVASLALAAAGFWLGLAWGWLLAAAVAALCAWDLDDFARRLESVEWPAATSSRRRALERGHFRRLAAVVGVGTLLAVVALAVEVRLSFLPAALLGLLAVWGLSRAVRYLRRVDW